MQDSSFKSINQTNEPSISRYEDEFAIVTELQACPLTCSIILHFKRSKWTLQRRNGKYDVDSECIAANKSLLLTLAQEKKFNIFQKKIFSPKISKGSVMAKICHCMCKFQESMNPQFPQQKRATVGCFNTQQSHTLLHSTAEINLR